MNVILIMCDTWRRDMIGAYGNEWIRTPNVEALARDATVFERAYCGSFPTLPCRRDVMTGRYEFPWRGWGGLDEGDVTLAGLIAESGRISHFISDVYHHWTRSAGNFHWDFSGFEYIRGQERDNWITDTDAVPDWPAPEYEQSGQITPHLKAATFRRDESDWFAPQVFTRAMRWLQHNAGHEDFFLWIDAFDPHEPWDPPKCYVDLYGDPDYSGARYVTPAYRPIEGYLTPEEFAYVQAMYAGEITMVDRWIGRLLDQVAAMSLMDETLIIVTTDHGTYNGDHGQVGKLQRQMFDGISHIPLIIRHPNHGRGARVNHFAQPIDLFPTILEGTGVGVPEEIHGKSLLPILERGEGASLRGEAFLGRFCFSMNITDGEHTLYQWPDRSNAPLYSYSPIKSKWTADDWGAFDGTRRLVGPSNANTGGGPVTTALYNIAEDPGEERDLADEDPAALRRMQEKLVVKLDEISAPAELRARFGLE